MTGVFRGVHSSGGGESGGRGQWLFICVIQALLRVVSELFSVLYEGRAITQYFERRGRDRQKHNIQTGRFT